VEVKIHAFLFSALVGLEWSALRLDLFNLREKCLLFPLGSSLGGPKNRSRRHGEKKNIFFLPGLELILLGITARSEPLYGSLRKYKGKIAAVNNRVLLFDLALKMYFTFIVDHRTEWIC
jgi:hypothetical protein